MNTLIGGLSENKKILVAALVGFLIGVGSVLVWNISRVEKTLETVADVEKVDTTGLETPNETVKKGGAAVVPVLTLGKSFVSVDDQPAGDLVQLTSVSLERDGWVAILESTDGQLGNVLGARRFPKGTSQGNIELLRGTVPGTLYYAVLYSDDGNRIFELGTDAQLVDSTKQPIKDSFTTYPSSPR